MMMKCLLRLRLRAFRTSSRQRGFEASVSRRTVDDALQVDEHWRCPVRWLPSPDARLRPSTSCHRRRLSPSPVARRPSAARLPFLYYRRRCRRLWRGWFFACAGPWRACELRAPVWLGPHIVASNSSNHPAALPMTLSITKRNSFPRPGITSQKKSDIDDLLTNSTHFANLGCQRGLRRHWPTCEPRLPWLTDSV